MEKKKTLNAHEWKNNYYNMSIMPKPNYTVNTNPIKVASALFTELEQS